jgi:ABC-2 type transport system permease protein
LESSAACSSRQTLSAKKPPDGKYQATPNVEARKVLADANGAETPMALADFIDIGVFSGKKDEEKPLYMRREKITREHETLITEI